MLQVLPFGGSFGISAICTPLLGDLLVRHWHTESCGPMISELQPTMAQPSGGEGSHTEDEHEQAP